MSAIPYFATQAVLEQNEALQKWQGYVEQCKEKYSAVLESFPAATEEFNRATREAAEHFQGYPHAAVEGMILKGDAVLAKYQRQYDAGQPGRDFTDQHGAAGERKDLLDRIAIGESVQEHIEETLRMTVKDPDTRQRLAVYAGAEQADMTFDRSTGRMIPNPEFQPKADPTDISDPENAKRLNLLRQRQAARGARLYDGVSPDTGKPLPSVRE